MKGQWKTIDGRSMPIRDMDEGHLKNSMRYLYRKILEVEATRVGPPLNRDSIEWERLIPAFRRDKLVELAEEAQHRVLIPQPLTMTQLFTICREWEEIAAANRRVYPPSNGYIMPPVVVQQALANGQGRAVMASALQAYAALAPAVLSVYVDVLDAVPELVMKKDKKAIALAEAEYSKVDRNLSFEL